MLKKKIYNVSDFKKKYNASGFDLKVLQRVRFWSDKKYNAVEFEIKFIRHVSF